MGCIYWIKTKTGIYIGKYHDKYTYFTYHLNRALPFSETRLKEAWERDWKESLAITGYKDNDFIQSSMNFDEEEVKLKIILSLDNSLKNSFFQNEISGEEVYNTIARMWGRADDTRSVSEALCILLGAKQFQSSLLNTQVDFMTKKDLTNIHNFFNLNEVRRIQSTVKRKWMPAIWFSFDPTDFSQIDDTIKKYIEKTTGQKVPINVLKHPKVVAALLPTLGKETISRIVAQLTDYKKYLKNKKHLDERHSVQKYLTKIINRVQEGGFESRTEVINMLKSMFNSAEWKSITRRNYNLEDDDDSISAILDILLKWYQDTSITDILSFNGTDNAIEKSVNFYKRGFTSYIQQQCFGVSPNEEYQQWKSDRLEWTPQSSDLYLTPGGFYPKFYKQKEGITYTGESYRFKTLNLLKAEDVYIKNNWNNIYPEQVAYYLTEVVKNPFDYSRTGALEGGFISRLSNYKEIKYF